MNEGDTWKVRNAAAAWRDAAYYRWIEHFPSVGPSGRSAPCPAVVHVTIPFPQQRRRDPINYAKTVKHIVDGFVMAGAWSDDTIDYVEQQIPTLIKGTELPVLVRVSAR